MIRNLGDQLTTELRDCLPIFLDRLKNEITRLTTVKALTMIASSPLKIDLRAILTEGIPILASFLRKNQRALKLSTLACLDMLVKNWGMLFKNWGYVVQELGYVGQELEYVGQELGYAVQELGYVGQELEYVGQELGHVGQELRYVVQELGYVGQELGYVGRELGYVVQELGYVGQELFSRTGVT
ncbi:hypothetical protein DPMN_021263 [Dreissena polymorpha]|uniref:Uncharacterized protein n=1 Tax=Dreissena polymorpha TaxID=45954 RepID=A0A9D4NNU3_DREPO|nr:hypothetical protein DPMN_021263 [Dreissena polymorpha]